MATATRQLATKLPSLTREVSRPATEFLEVLDEEELELELDVEPDEVPEDVPEAAVDPALELDAVAEPFPLLVTAVQTPRPVVEVTYCEAYADVSEASEKYGAQMEFAAAEASQLEIAASWLLMEGPLTLYKDSAAEV